MCNYFIIFIIMEFSIVESSLLECIKHIKQHFISDMSNCTHTSTSCILQVMKTYNHYYPILCEFLPKVLNPLIIEYANDIFDIIIFVQQIHYGIPVRSIAELYLINSRYLSKSYDYEIIVINTELNICYTYKIRYWNSSVIFYDLYIRYIHDIKKTYKLYVSHVHHSFVDYYMKQYHPKKEQLCINYCHDLEQNHWNYLHNTNAIMSHIENHEQFSNELTVIIALFNQIYNFVL